MEAKTIDSLEKIDSSEETTDLIERWLNIVKPRVDVKRQVEKITRTKFFCGERTIDKSLSEIIRRLESPAVENRNWPIQNQRQTDYFPDWQFTEARNFERGYIPQDENQPSTSQALPTSFYSTDETPMEEGECSSDSELDRRYWKYQPITWPTILE